MNNTTKHRHQPSTEIRDHPVNTSCHVVHCKRERYDVYIGRPSKWGNPFSHKQGTRAEFVVNSRQEAVTAYRKWITEGDGRYLLHHLHELTGKTLGCWCKPNACHGDVLVDLVRQAAKSVKSPNLQIS